MASPVLPEYVYLITKILGLIGVGIVLNTILYETYRELKKLKAAETKFNEMLTKTTPVSVDDIMQYLGLSNFSWFVIFEIAMRTDVDLYKALEYCYQQINACHEQLFSMGTYAGGFILDECFYATPSSKIAGEMLMKQDYQRKSAQQLLSTIQSVQTAVYNLEADRQKILERLNIFDANMSVFNNMTTKMESLPEEVEEWSEDLRLACLTGEKEEFVRGIFIDEYGGNASISSLATGRATGGKPVETFRAVMMWFYRLKDYRDVDNLVKERKVNPAVGTVLKRKFQEYMSWKLNYYKMLNKLKLEIEKNMALQRSNLRTYKMWAARHIAQAEKTRLDTLNVFQRTSERGSMDGVVREQVEWVPRIRYCAYFLFCHPLWHAWKPIWKILVERAMVVYSEPGTPFYWGRIRTWAYAGMVEVERLNNVVGWAQFNVWWKGDPAVFNQNISSKRARSHAFLMYWLNKASGFSPWETIDYSRKLFNDKKKPKWLKDMESAEDDFDAEEFPDEYKPGTPAPRSSIGEFISGAVNFLTFGWLNILYGDGVLFDPENVTDNVIIAQVKRINSTWEPLSRGIIEAWYAILDVGATFGLYPAGMGVSYSSADPPIDRYGRFRGPFGSGIFCSRRRRAAYAMLAEIQPIFTAAVQEVWRGATMFELHHQQGGGR